MAEMLSNTQGYAPFGAYQLWYKVTGDLGAAKAPLVVLHGGPGCTHDYVDSFKELAASGRAVVHFDQLGSGRSTHLPEKGPDFWTVQLFLDQVDALLAHLGIADRYHVLGQSWGGMLGSEHAVRKPRGLKSLILANSLAAMSLWIEGAAQLREEMPEKQRDALIRYEALGDYSNPEYKAAERAFYDRHVCRIPWPEEVARTFAAMEEDSTVYRNMNGPNEFHVIGTMKDWSIIDRLAAIDVPTFVFRGEYDEATQACIQPFIDHIPDVRWTVFANASHMPHVEVKEECLGAVQAFLDEVDPG
ncbi:proline iminopeptidase-family hydrolase [Allorhizobium sp. BGMRC 0089]|uniref:proline iminopeptidase-family hydrolase n=1 Tax=Allorhizobium sonneratiae TaxID=2934936 RepID=UPI0020341C96|nr:proline iminopeptidase-family hydrolase [Allorhizobium sonneratiae]MCM2293127.1 proline iminopeptidase-family hydrolase [Allorhizobium sonneratiae]